MESDGSSALPAAWAALILLQRGAVRLQALRASSPMDRATQPVDSAANLAAVVLPV